MTQEPSALVPNDADAFYQAIDTFRIYCGVVLLSFDHYGHDLRETISRNFIARGMSCSQSIFAVWKAGSEQDAWILHRSLVDRLLHLHYLEVTNSFSEFEEYSFLSIYEAREKLISDPFMNNRIPQHLKEFHKAEKSRYSLLSAKQTKWHRPKARDVARQMDLNLIYNLGYDYASMHVHPMSNDGNDDFKTLTEAPQERTLPDATVVRNSILVQSLIVQEALNISKMRWRAIVYDFLCQIREFLGTGDTQYLLTMYKISKAWPDFQLCESPNTKARA
jgi:hypothetical protein